MVCGVGVTMARRSLNAALSSVLLPTFGRPMMAAVPERWTPCSREVCGDSDIVARSIAAAGAVRAADIARVWLVHRFN